MMDHLARSNSLFDLAACINIEHQASDSAMRRGVEHAIRAGELLLEAKNHLKHGQWLPWLAEYCELSDWTAQLYMRLARHKPELEATQRVTDLSVRGAIAVIDNNAMQWVVDQLRGIDPGMRLTATGMELSPDLPFASWAAIGNLLRSLPQPQFSRAR
jgi:Protein of unknown function (DUF3102)